MIRLTLLTLFVTFLTVYAWKDWYKALCGVIVLMAVIEHPDMPRTLLGVQGLSPWNIVLASVVCSWLAHRSGEGLRWDLPRYMNVLLLLYLAVLVIGFFRMFYDRSGLDEWALLNFQTGPSASSLVSEYVINTLKWVIPGLLLFDGCRNRERLMWALSAILGVYVLLGIQVIKWMPIETLVSGSDLEGRSSKILRNEVGYHRVNLSMMLAGASWAIFCTRGLVQTRLAVLGILGASGTVLFAQMLTGGRTGYATWGVVGLVILFFRWRAYVLLAPLVVALVVATVPAAKERMLQGFTEESRDTNVKLHSDEDSFQSGPDLYTVTAGRNVAWPYVIDEILKSPWIGYGTEGMKRTGLSQYLWTEFGESFPHPHNAYLQLLMDHGIVGAIPIVLFYLVILVCSVRLFRNQSRPEYVAVGGVALSLTLALLIASMGSQSFFPEEGVVGLWCAMGLMLRIYQDRTAQEAAQEAEPESMEQQFRYAQMLGGGPGSFRG